MTPHLKWLSGLKRREEEGGRGGLCSGISPESSVERPVPADEGTWREEQEPEDGEAEVHTPTGVHTEPGQAAHQVGQQRPSVNWEGVSSNSIIHDKHFAPWWSEMGTAWSKRW